ncbi:MAG TPA: NAD(P)H-dependent oxidoreductase subunit E [Thermoanaerobaculia bacterium]|nr:NAD(P)H-dependent oxidoreductase subunit E [Thermoanaerobaculia bacterium]
MDLHFTADLPTPAEREAIDGCLAGLPPVAPYSDRRQYLLPVLHAIQGRVGWISPGAMNHACRQLEVPPAEAFGVADFYALFQTRPHPPVTVHVCDDIGCRFLGGEALCGEMEATIGAAGTSPDGHVTWHRSPCLGLCERAPAALVIAAGDPPREQALAPATVAEIGRVATNIGPAIPIDLGLSVPQMGEPGLRLLSRVGRLDPASLDAYRAAGGFLALRRAFEMGPERVVREVIDAKLVGRGGAAFPTGQKWLGVRSTAEPRYLICNADESEPGTFKDRVLMEGDPFALVESMTIAGFATGCEKGYLYIRGEYPLATGRLAHAIQTCRDRGYLGENILGDGVRFRFKFDIELRRGAGAYICGEETALMNSLEGRRGEPRNKPPFPTQVGLFGQPTVINNVETLVNVLPIVIYGGKAFASVGTERSTGTKLFCLSGHVARPGVYEVPFGVTLRQLLELAGGIGGSGRLQAVLLGGAAGAFVTPDQLDVPLTFEGTRAAGATLGSGVVMPFDDTVDLRQVLRRIAQFFRDESCGQCVPCRVGAVRQEEVLNRLAHDRPLGSVAAELELLKELGQVMRDASICGLGQTASSAVESALARFPIFEEK